MEHNPRNLPSTKALFALERVVFHESIKKASEDLHVTHSAVSKQITLLENWVGQTLFDKNQRRMVPTPNALVLADAARDVRQVIGDALTRIGAGPVDGVLRIAAPATFAMRWLIPRLWSFSNEHDGVSVKVIASHTGEPWEETAYDVAIQPASRAPLGASTTPVFSESLGLLIAPDAFPKSVAAGRLIMSRLPLLKAETRDGELENWLEFAGHSRGLARTARCFPHFYIALEAALAGEGALVSPILTTGDLIRKGDLCEPLPQFRVPGEDYVAFAAPGSDHRHHGSRFIDWLTRSAGKAALASPPNARAEGRATRPAGPVGRNGSGPVSQSGAER